MNDNVVTRIAPSPTGEMHIGTVRTALINYIFAKQHSGKYLVRVEDTDKERNKQEWVDAIWRDFQWCELEPDEKYIQSQHVARHKELLLKLVSEDKAYISKEQKKDDPTQTVEVVRLRNPGIPVTFEDLVRGPVTFDTTELGDFVIARSIDDPLYHFAVVVDDGDAGVTHVIRGDDHISNTPRQILILEALGFTRPAYAHLPLILAPDRTKLSKRKHGASLENYRAQGFLHEAILNYLALLGWNPGTEQELFTLEQLIQTFSLERVHKAGAVFDIEKMKWFNQEYLRKLSAQEYQSQLSSFIQARGEPVPTYMPEILTELRNRARTFGEAADFLKDGEFSFMEESIDVPTVELLLQGAKAESSAVKGNLQKVHELLSQHEVFTAESVKEAIFDYASQQGRASVLWPMRVALSGKEKSPDPFTLAGLLGKEKTLERIEKASQLL